MSWLGDIIGKWHKKIEDSVVQFPVVPAELDFQMRKFVPLPTYTEILDGEYTCVSYEDLKKVVSLGLAKYKVYQTDIFDCEDYARVFWTEMKLLFPTIAIGYCHVNIDGNKHALNWAVYKTKNGYDFTFIEPQQNKVSYFAGYKPYLMLV
jgi:hypothetical protein